MQLRPAPPIRGCSQLRFDRGRSAANHSRLGVLGLCSGFRGPVQAAPDSLPAPKEWPFREGREKPLTNEPTAPEVSPRTQSQTDSDNADLADSLASLSRLVNGSIPLERLLAQVATFAVGAVPGADGAGVTLLQMDAGANHVVALAASDPFVAEIDRIQYSVVGEGPCITAAFERRTVRSGSLGGEKQWPHFGPRVGRLGVHSVLSLPLLLPGQLVGAINVYGRAKDVFDDRAAELGELFAIPAAVSVHNAQVLASAQVLAIQLQEAVATRCIIDQAIGLLRSRSGLTAQEALGKLRAMSQSQGLRLAVVAERLMDHAVGRARAGDSVP